MIRIIYNVGQRLMYYAILPFWLLMMYLIFTNLYVLYQFNLKYPNYEVVEIATLPKGLKNYDRYYNDLPFIEANKKAWVAFEGLKDVPIYLIIFSLLNYLFGLFLPIYYVMQKLGHKTSDCFAYSFQHMAERPLQDMGQALRKIGVKER